ncbi:MAG: hypothetical protein ACOYLG_10390 [Chitinophagaceae bacterium]
MSVSLNCRMRIRQMMLGVIFFLLQVSMLHAQKKKNPVAVKIPDTQIVSYEVLENGDTINRMDNKKQKQGKWLITTEGRYGEEGFHELGEFKNNIRQGKWGKYDLDGHIQAEEHYKNGLLEGEARYYSNGYLYCVGNYLALSAKYEYDSIMVEDPKTDEWRMVVLRADRGSVRHGFWTYYQAPSMKVTKVLEYQADEIIYEKEYGLNQTDSTYIQQRMKAWPHVTNKPMPQVWYCDKRKKPVKYTDIPDDTQYVTPNVRRKQQ